MADCLIHKVAMSSHTKDGKTWDSHQTEDGKWCYGKPSKPDTSAQIAMMNSITNAIAFFDPYRSGDMAKDLTAVGELALKFYNKIREAK